MKIGLLSDSHKKIKRTQYVIDLLKAQGAEYLLHAGDIVKEENLIALKKSGLPYKAVLGNNDRDLAKLQHQFELFKEPHCFEIDDTRFALMHHPHFINTNHDVIVYGHTHTFDAKRKQHTLIVNPGEACGRNKPLSECAILTMHDESFTIDYYYRAIGTDQWVTKQHQFERDLKAL